MAIGVIFSDLTPGYGADLMSYLFGSILMVTKGDIISMGLLCLILSAFVPTFYGQLLAYSYDEEYARTRAYRHLSALCRNSADIVFRRADNPHSRPYLGHCASFHSALRSRKVLSFPGRNDDNFDLAKPHLFGVRLDGGIQI